VPVSATPVLIDAVKTGPVPLPAVQINPSQISAAGGTIGQAMCLTISGWAAGACGGGGGGGSGLSATCTWSALEAGSCGAGSLTAVMTWAQIEAL
jgi:hypothetical protein